MNRTRARRARGEASARRATWLVPSGAVVVLSISAVLLILLMMRSGGPRKPGLSKSKVAVDGVGVDRVLNLIDSHFEEGVALLKEAVSIESVSVGSARSEKGLADALQHFMRLAREVGLDGVRAVGPEPGVILAEKKVPDAKNTVLVYAHWDVQPAVEGQGGWTQNPFRVWQSDGRLYGRGVSDDKAAMVMWLWILNLFNRADVDLGVNFKLLAEGEEEIGSPKLQRILDDEAREGSFLTAVDFCVVSDGSFMSDRPSIGIGTRGAVHAEVTIQGPARDLHSGTYGGGVHEPLAELITLMSTITDGRGSVTIDGMHQVAHLSIDQEELSSFNLDLKQWEREAGVQRCARESAVALLQQVWGDFSATVHGIRASADYETAAIAAEARSHLSVRVPAGADLDHVEALIKAHLQKRFDEFQTPNSMNVTVYTKAPGYSTSADSAMHRAAHRAIVRARSTEPQTVRFGGSIPVAALLSSAVPGSDVLVLPIGGKEDGAHGFESIALDNLRHGARTFAILLDELSRV